jgi:hypothetical protein
MLETLAMRTLAKVTRQEPVATQERAAASKS